MTEIWESVVEQITNIKLWLQLAGAAIAALWAGLPELVQLLLFMQVVDIAAGVLKGFINRELDPDVSYVGLAKKVFVLLLVGMAARLEPTTGMPLAQATAGFFTVYEAISIVRNAVLVGLPVPDELVSALAKIPGGYQEDLSDLLKRRERGDDADGDPVDPAT